MNLLVARTMLQSRPPKRMLENTAYEVVIMSVIAVVLVVVF